MGRQPITTITYDYRVIRLRHKCRSSTVVWPTCNRHKRTQIKYHSENTYLDGHTNIRPKDTNIRHTRHTEPNIWDWETYARRTDCNGLVARKLQFEKLYMQVHWPTIETDCTSSWAQRMHTFPLLTVSEHLHIPWLFLVFWEPWTKFVYLSHNSN